MAMLHLLHFPGKKLLPHLNRQSTAEKLACYSGSKTSTSKNFNPINYLDQLLQ